MQETYTRKEAAEALGIGLRTLYDWRKAAGILSDAEGYAPLTRAEVELLATSHKRVLREVQPHADPLSLAARITALEQQVQSLQEQITHVNRLLIAQLSATASASQPKDSPSSISSLPEAK